ncbi:MAG: nucleotidyltransferase family protein [Planctomycetota bacterium]
MLVDDLQVDRDRLAEVCERYGVERLEVFGSFTRGEAEAESDLDVLVSFRPGARGGLEFVGLQQELEELFGRPVDLLTRKSVERSPNKYFRRFALSQTEPIYESA